MFAIELISLMKMNLFGINTVIIHIIKYFVSLNNKRMTYTVIIYTKRQIIHIY